MGEGRGEGPPPFQLHRYGLVAMTAQADPFPIFGEPAKVEVRLAEADLHSLRVNSRQYVPADVRAFGKTWRDIQLRVKGNGTFQPIDGKPSLTLDFRDFKIHLNNSLDDPSHLNEFVGSYLSTLAGMDVPRVGHAVVTLNGRRLGLYVAKEGFDSPPIELPDDAVPTWEELKRMVEVNSFCGFMALEIMMCHWDGYSLRRNNFRAFAEPKTGRAVFRPAGMDQLFGKPDLSWIPEMTGPLARAVMAEPQGRALYEEHFKRIFASVFDSLAIRKIIDARVAQLKPVLDESEFASLRGEATELCDRISKREEYLRGQLANPQVPAVLESGRLALTDWKPVDAPDDAVRRDSQHLGIAAPEGAFSTWRTTILLERGRYRFNARARVSEAVPLAFGKSRGATLRVAGKMLNSGELLGTTEWKPLCAEFEVTDDQEKVILICQFRAARGEAWFDIASLELIRL